MSKIDTERQGSDGTKNNTPKLCPASKWAVLCNDMLIPVPDRLINESVIRHQAEIPEDHVIIRDHNHTHDPVVPRGSDIDQKDGSVFYSVPECDLNEHRPNECPEPPKFVVSVDDRFEVVIRRDQTGGSISELFKIEGDHDLFRDLESPSDEKMTPDEVADLKDGNVFVTRRNRTLEIKVNSMPFLWKDGVRRNMTGQQIGSLAFPDIRRVEVTEITGGKEVGVPLNQTIKIDNCDEFEVIACDVNAGFQQSRLEREIDLLRSGGGTVEFIDEPEPLIIYRGLRIRRKDNAYTVDVLVRVPPGYPSGIPDNAYLPVESPLMNVTLGSAQNEFIEVAGFRWQKKSIHPYTGKASVRWNQNIHGFHTYLGEILSWLSK